MDERMSVHFEDFFGSCVIGSHEDYHESVFFI